MSEKKNSVLNTLSALDRYSIDEGFENVGSDVSILTDDCAPKELIITRTEWNIALGMVMDATPRATSSMWKIFLEFKILKDLSDDGKNARFDVERAREIYKKTKGYHDEF